MSVGQVTHLDSTHERKAVMIKGEAQLIIGHETMVTIVQKWLDDNVSSYKTPTPQVIMVLPMEFDGVDRDMGSYKISLKERLPDPPKTV